MKYCIKCGAQCLDTAKFCTECGASLEATENPVTEEFNEVLNEVIVEEEPETVEAVEVYSYTSDNTSNEKKEDKYTFTYENNSTVNAGIAPRNIIVAIILSFVTCGIYQLYWLFKMNNEVNELSGNTTATSGGLVILFDIITCGIYGIFWSYKMGERCDTIKGSVGGSSHILYLILTLLGFGIVTLCLIQDTINKAVA